MEDLKRICHNLNDFMDMLNNSRKQWRNKL